MNKELESKSKVIIKFIDKIYNPTKIEVDTLRNYDTVEIVIDVFFDEIDDKYNTNPLNNNIRRLKETNFGLKIRKDIHKYFRIMTSGLSLEGFAPYKHHGITIKVHLNIPDEN